MLSFFLQAFLGLMYFQWSTEVELLFRGWKTPTWYFYLLSCFGVMLLAIMLEGIRLIIHNVTHSRRSYAASLPRRLADMLLYGLYVFIGYMVMLVVMTYNIGIFIAVLLGYCIGNLIFPRRPVLHLQEEGVASLDGDRATIMYSPAAIDGSCH